GCWYQTGIKILVAQRESAATPSSPPTTITMSSPKASLRAFLATQPPGTLLPGSAEKVVGILEACWIDLEGSGEESMHAGKLARAEDLIWHPPILSFVIERHGGTVLGSTRAELHRWEIDVDRGSATCDPQAGRRQLRRQSPALNVEPLAEEIGR